MRDSWGTVLAAVNEHAKILKSHPPFSELPTRILHRLTERSEVIEMGKGEMVYREGAPGTFLYLLISGRRQSVIRLPNGSEQALDIFGPGDTFGERALLSQGTNWTSVHVVTDSVLLRLNGDDVHRVVAVASVSESVVGQMIAANLASAIRHETRASVLFVCIMAGAEVPRLGEGHTGKRKTDIRGHLQDGGEGFGHLARFVPPGGDLRKEVAPTISRLSSMHALQTRVVEGACKQADVVLRPVVCDGRWNDFDDTRRFIEHGAREAEENLEALLALVDRG